METYWFWSGFKLVGKRKSGLGAGGEDARKPRVREGTARASEAEGGSRAVGAQDRQQCGRLGWEVRRRGGGSRERGRGQKPVVTDVVRGGAEGRHRERCESKKHRRDGLAKGQQRQARVSHYEAQLST